MKILEYKYSDGPQGGWNYSRIKLGRINLFVGESGSGKTKLLNTIFNICQLATSKGQKNYRGSWELVFTIGNVQYEWIYENFSGAFIDREVITKGVGEEREVLVNREQGTFTYKQKELPKLSRQQSAFSLLEDEDDIAPIIASIKKVVRRNFFSDELERAASLGNVTTDLEEQLKEKKDLKLLSKDVPLSLKLYFLQKYFPDMYRSICETFISIFPSVTACDVVDSSTVNVAIKLPGKVPIFAIQEKGVAGHIGIHDLSSGMQKVLLLLADIITLESDNIYLLDEYENSLGINAINFLPGFLGEYGGNSQFIITTHHPYLINNIPTRDWHVFHRTGSKVEIKFGVELEERFGKSKQKAFLQLINDPFFTEGRA